MSKVKIVSDGSPQGTTIIADGVELDDVTDVTWQLHCNGPRAGLARATLTLLNVEVELMAEDAVIEGLIAEADRKICAYTNPARY
jgi:hypothetical protein